MFLYARARYLSTREDFRNESCRVRRQCFAFVSLPHGALAGPLWLSAALPCPLHAVAPLLQSCTPRTFEARDRANNHQSYPPLCVAYLRAFNVFNDAKTVLSSSVARVYSVYFRCTYAHPLVPPSCLCLLVCSLALANVCEPWCACRSRPECRTCATCDQTRHAAPISADTPDRSRHSAVARCRRLSARISSFLARSQFFVSVVWGVCLLCSDNMRVCKSANNESRVFICTL